MKIYKAGTKIHLIAANINGEIVSVTIEYNNVWYKASYYFDGEYKNVVMMEHEFTTTESKINIGFK